MNETEAAFKAWRHEGTPITRAAREHQLEPDDIMLYFKRHHRVEFTFFMARFNLAVGIATILVAIGGLLKDVRNAIERSLG